MKKNISSVLLIAMLIVAMCVVNVQAASGKVEMAVSKTSLKHGDTVVITISAEAEAGINAILATIDYDQNVLEMTEKKVSDTSKWIDLSDSNNIAVMCNSTENVINDNIYTVTFKVIGNTQGKTIISLKNIKLDTNENSDTSTIDINDLKLEISIVTNVANNNTVNNNTVNNNTVNNNTVSNNTVNNNTVNNNTVNNNTVNNNTVNNNTVNNNTVNNNAVNNNTVNNNTVNNNIVNNNTINNNTVNNNMTQENKDNTKSPSSIPQTGSSNFEMIAIIGLSAVAIISFVIYRRYKL